MMLEYFDKRIKELRKLYNSTGRVEYKYRCQELFRAREHFLVLQLNDKAKEQP